MRYRSDVDGLRAVAVLPVLLFHAGGKYLSGGFVGVDIFFVISGFVIASKLLDDIENGRFSITNFYIRRIRRIIPALAMLMLFSTMAALLFFLPGTLRDFSQSLSATAMFFSNMYFWRHSGYFETEALSSPLLHTWSLSVEEQFYIAIPILLFLTCQVARRMAWLLFALASVVSLALSIWLTYRGPTANFFLLATRAWELLLGVIVSLLQLPPARNPVLREGLAAAGLALIAFAVVGYSDATPFPGLAAVPPTLGAALIIQQSDYNQLTLASRALSWRPLVGIGLISYSLYLVHWPIIVFARYWLLRDLTLFEIGGVVAVSMLLAWCSWRFVERRFRRFRPGTPPWRVFSVTGGVLAVFALLGFFATSSHGIAAWFPRQERSSLVSRDDWLNGRCFLMDQKPDAWRPDLCRRTTGAARNALRWGDSFAAQYIQGLVHNENNLTHNIIQYTYAGCPPILSYRSYARPGCEQFNARVFEVIWRFQIDVVVLTCRWDQLRQRGLAGLSETVDALRAAGVSVFVIGQSPAFSFDVNILNYRGAGAGTDSADAQWYLSFDPAQNEAIRQASGAATFVDPLPAFCRDGQCKYKSGNRLLFYDYGHFSESGSDLAVRSYFPLLKAAGDPAIGSGGARRSPDRR